MEDVSDRKIVSQGGIDERARGDKHCQERRHAGTAGSFRQSIADSVFTYSCDDTDHKTVAGQRQSK